MDKKTIIFVFGTRPEFIKMLPLILQAKKDQNIRSIVCSTGQHKEMLDSLYMFLTSSPTLTSN